jgi:hypothetical protein
LRISCASSTAWRPGGTPQRPCPTSSFDEHVDHRCRAVRACFVHRLRQGAHPLQAVDRDRELAPFGGHALRQQGDARELGRCESLRC